MGPHMPLRPEAGLAAAGLFSGSAKLACAARAVSIAGLCTQLRRSEAPGGGPSFAGHRDAQRRPCTRRGRAAHAVWAAEPRRYRHRARRLRQHQGQGLLMTYLQAAVHMVAVRLLQTHVHARQPSFGDIFNDASTASTQKAMQLHSVNTCLEMTVTFCSRTACHCLHHVLERSAVL